MPIFTVTPTLPKQALGAGDDLALDIEEFTGLVEGTLARESKFAPFVDVRPVRGTSTLTNEGIGESTLQVLVKGQAPDPTETEFNRINLTVDTTIIARNWVAQIDDLQKNYAVKAEIAREHGQKIAKLHDQAFAIQAIKAARLAGSAYGALPGHSGGNTQTLNAAGDRTDPAALYAALSKLFAAMEAKDVDPQSSNVMVALRPDAFYALLDAEQIVNSNYVTYNGKEIASTKMLKAFNVPVISSNNVPNTVITGHPLSNSRNSNSFDGDFTKLVAVAFSPRSLLAGETVPLSTDIWWDQKSKGYFIDAWLAFSATPNRAEFAGQIVIP